MSDIAEAINNYTYYYFLSRIIPDIVVVGIVVLCAIGVRAVWKYETRRD